MCQRTPKMMVSMIFFCEFFYCGIISIPQNVPVSVRHFSIVLMLSNCYFNILFEVVSSTKVPLFRYFFHNQTHILYVMYRLEKPPSFFIYYLTASDISYALFIFKFSMYVWCMCFCVMEVPRCVQVHVHMMYLHEEAQCLVGCSPLYILRQHFLTEPQKSLFTLPWLGTLLVGPPVSVSCTHHSRLETGSQVSSFCNPSSEI